MPLEGNSSSAEANSVRIFLGLWWVFVIIVVTLYSGALVGFLTFPIIAPTVQSINELVTRQNAAEDVTWGFLNGR